jgi:hypothetical protein
MRSSCLLPNVRRGCVVGFLCCRYAFHDDKLPRWFAEDERRHMRPLPQVQSVWLCVGGGGILGGVARRRAGTCARYHR